MIHPYFQELLSDLKETILDHMKDPNITKDQFNRMLDNYNECFARALEYSMDLEAQRKHRIEESKRYWSLPYGQRFEPKPFASAVKKDA